MKDDKIILKSIKIGLLADELIGKTAICRALFNL